MVHVGEIVGGVGGLFEMGRGRRNSRRPPSPAGRSPGGPWRSAGARTRPRPAWPAARRGRPPPFARPAERAKPSCTLTHASDQWLGCPAPRCNAEMTLSIRGSWEASGPSNSPRRRMASAVHRTISCTSTGNKTGGWTTPPWATCRRDVDLSLPHQHRVGKLPQGGLQPARRQFRMVLPANAANVALLPIRLRPLARFQHLRQRLRIGQSVFVPDHDQGRLRQAAVPHQFLGIGERHHFIGLGVQDDRAGLDRLRRSPLLPGRAEQDQRASPELMFTGHGPAPA